MDQATLKSYRHMASEIEEIQEEVERLRAKAESGVSTDGLRHSGFAPDRTSDIVAKIGDLCTVLERKMEALIGLLCDIEGAIESLEPVERRLIRLRYVRCLAWDEVFEAIGYGESRGFKIHRDAIKNLESP